MPSQDPRFKFLFQFVCLHHPENNVSLWYAKSARWKYFDPSIKICRISSSIDWPSHNFCSCDWPGADTHLRFKSDQCQLQLDLTSTQATWHGEHTPLWRSRCVRCWLPPVLTVTSLDLILVRLVCFQLAASDWLAADEDSSYEEEDEIANLTLLQPKTAQPTAQTHTHREGFKAMFSSNGESLLCEYCWLRSCLILVWHTGSGRGLQATNNHKLSCPNCAHGLIQGV